MNRQITITRYIATFSLAELIQGDCMIGSLPCESLILARRQGANDGTYTVPILITFDLPEGEEMPK